MHPQAKLVAAKKVGKTRIKIKNKSKLNTKSVFRKTINNLDKIISKNMRKHKSNTLGSCQKIKDATPVTLATVYDPTDQTKIVKDYLVILLDSGSSHSMAKASILNKYKKDFFVKEESSYKTAAGTFSSKYNMEIDLTLDEFGRSTKIKHRFDLDENEDGIGYDMIIGRDLLTKLNIDVRFSDKTIKWEDQLIPMKSFTQV